MAVNLPIGVLGWVANADLTPLVTKVDQACQLLKELGAEGAKNEQVQNLFKEIAAEADKAGRAFTPVINQARAFAKEMCDVANAVGSGTISLEAATKRYRNLEPHVSDLT